MQKHTSAITELAPGQHVQTMVCRFKDEMKHRHMTSLNSQAPFPDHCLQKTGDKMSDKSGTSSRHLLHLQWCHPQIIPVSVENHILAQTSGTTTLLNPLTPPHTCPEALQEANRAVLGAREVMATHDRLDGFSRFLGVVEWNGGYVVVQDVGFDYSVEQRAADESELAVDGGCGSAGKGPRLGSVMRDRGIGMLQVCDCD